VREDVLKYRHRPLKDIVAPITKNQKALLGEKCIALFVAVRFEMLAALDFNDGLLIETSKIKDVVVERHLPAKFKSSKPAVSEQPPHCQLGIGSGMSH
jgi:hypothetical protein